jgi:hypothetical protein
MIIDKLQRDLKTIKKSIKNVDETDEIYKLYKKTLIEIEDYLGVFGFTADYPDEDLLKYPTLLTNIYFIKSKHKITEELDEILESRGFKLNLDYWELKEIEKLLRKGFNKCVLEEKKDYLLAFKKMIYLQLLQVDMDCVPYLKKEYGEAPRNEELLEDIYSVVKRGCYSIGETINFRDNDYDPSYTDDYWHKIEKD